MPKNTHPLHQFKFCPKCGSGEFIENNFKSKRCNSCRFVYYFNSSAATVAVIINSQKEILVATRASQPAKGTLDLPGGFVDMLETAEEAVAREVKEETGLDILTSHYLFSIPNEYVYSDFRVETTDLFFICKINEKDVYIANDDVASLQFIAIKELRPEDFGLQSIRKGIEKIQKMNL